MPKSIYGQGTVIYGKVTFSDPDSVATPLDARTGHTLLDPSVVVVRLRAPNGVVTTYTYGTDAELTRDGQGKYRLRFTLTQKGTYRWTWAPYKGVTALSFTDECDSISVV